MPDENAPAHARAEEGTATPALRRRRTLPHNTPTWVDEEALYFVTICTVPRSQNQVCLPGLSERLHDSVTHREALGQWWVPVLLLMPDHVHMIVHGAEQPGLPRVVADWKRYAARHFGIGWQPDFFEQRPRRDESFEEKTEYIRQNPVRAKLVDRAEDWPYVWIAW